MGGKGEKRSIWALEVWKSGKGFLILFLVASVMSLPTLVESSLVTGLISIHH